MMVLIMRELPLSPIACFAFLAVTAYAASDAYPPARFTDPQRVAKLESAFPKIDKLFQEYVAQRGIPGMTWGIVIDGRLAHVQSTGLANRGSGAAPSRDTVFRIASMTKSFTALAILKLRDDGKLSLEDPVAKWIPEFARMEMPTRDTPPLRVRDLLTHGAGFPEDNPWGDQQLGASDDELTAWLKKGIPFSSTPGTRYEYSNYGFGLLGRVVTKAAGMPYEKYLQTQILAPLKMTASTLNSSDVPADRRAVGYRRLPDGSYAEEPPLPHGAFGAMGGLLTSASDLGKYVAFQLAAWPPRDDDDPGPVRRSSVREMNHLWRTSNLAVRRPAGKLQAEVSGYGYGLRISADCRFDHIVGHGGGLPGYGSYMAWLPNHGVGIFAMTNLTYAGPSRPIGEAWDILLATGGLRPRELPAAPILTKTRDSIVKLWKSWDSAEIKKIAAMNLLIDIPEQQRQNQIRDLKADVGECSSISPVMAENWLRGQFNMTCEKGTVGVFFTLAPTRAPGVQALSFQRIAEPSTRLSAPTGAPPGITCSE
ncbi:MAG TPA: serine hydrolase domain-containing protein [Bryobacteraceae bacterium]|nr:serine hydrolase domain-containing protein [Bryobacteraceae bacterium]